MKRKRNLAPAETDKLLSIIKMDNSNLGEKVGAAILLEDFEQAEMLFQQLSADEQKEFDSYPIAKLKFRKDIQSI